MKRQKAENDSIRHDDTNTTGLDWSKSRRVVFANLKPSTTTISLRLPAGLLARIKSEANKRDVPYQSYMKILLANALAD